MTTANIVHPPTCARCGDLLRKHFDRRRFLHISAGAGLIATFTVGLWNIGIEGQITLGAIFATWANCMFVSTIIARPSAVWPERLLSTSGLPIRSKWELSGNSKG